MTHAAIACHLVFDVTAHAPPHAQRRDLGHLRHTLYFPVARRARLRAECFDVTHVRETREAGKRVDANPFRRLAIAPRIAHELDLRAFGARSGRVAFQSLAGSATHHLMAAEAGLQCGNPRLARNGGGIMAIHTGDLIFAGVDVVAEKNRLARPLEVAGITDDGSLVACCGSRLRLLAVRGRRREGENQRHHDRS